MQIAGYLASLGIGLLLGLIGCGGSILTLPVLVYLFGISPLMATSYSLFIVGIVSLIGFISHYRQDLVHVRTGLFFGLTSVITVFITRHFIVPGLPEILFRVAGIPVHTDLFMMILFAILMISASVMMIRNPKQQDGRNTHRQVSFPLLAAAGGIIGMITGLLGAGGGFLLIPALILFAKLPVKQAVGTSLLIITLNSFVGISSGQGIQYFDWWLLGKIVLIAMTGLFAGMRLAQFIPPPRLKKGFGVFVLVLGFYILITELIKL